VPTSNEAVAGVACCRMIFEDPMALLAAMEREGVRYVMVGSMKHNTVREQDRLDARMLQERFGNEVD